MPAVSAIIPTYNCARYLPEAIDSVLAQTYRDFEIIVVDDGSTDNTQEVLAPYGDRVRVIKQPNQGRSAARNTGILAARGEYVAFLDADDLWLSRKLGKQMAFLEARPDVRWVYSDYAMFDEGGRQCESVFCARRVACLPETQAVLHALPGGIVWTGTVLVEASCFKEVGAFDSSLPVSEDSDMWVRLACRFAAGCIRDTLALYRRHPGQVTSRAQSGLFEYCRCRRYRRFLREQKGQLPPNVRRAAVSVARRCYADAARGVAEVALAAGHKRRARRWFLRALSAACLDRANRSELVPWYLGRLLDTVLPESVMQRVRGLKRRLGRIGGSRLRLATADERYPACRGNGAGRVPCVTHTGAGLAPRPKGAILLAVPQFSQGGGIEEQALLAASALTQSGYPVCVYSCERVSRKNPYRCALSILGVPVFAGLVSSRLLSVVELAAQWSLLPMRVALSVCMMLGGRRGWSSSWQRAGTGLRWRLRATLHSVWGSYVCWHLGRVARKIRPALMQVNGRFAPALVRWAARSRLPFVYRETNEVMLLGREWDWLGPVLDRASAIISPSEAQAEQLRKRFGRLQAPVFVVPNLIRWIPAAEVSLPRQGDEVVIGTLGRLRAEKGHRYLLAAMKDIAVRWPSAKLLVGGDGDEAEALRHRARSAGIEGSVTFLGAIPRSKLGDFMRAVDVFVMPSLSEGFGVALVEAMGYGKAVIASRVGGMAELVNDRVDGILVPPADAAALAQAICSLAADPKRRLALGRHARKTYETRHDPHVSVAPLLRVYDHVTGGRA